MRARRGQAGTGPATPVPPEGMRLTGGARAVWRELRDTALAIAAGLAAALLLRHFAVQTYHVEGPSMQPTLWTGERLLVDKLVLRLHPPRAGQIVVLQPPLGRCAAVLPGSPDFVKRVIATGGQTVSITNGVVLVDGGPQPEPYLVALDGDPTDQLAPLTVPPGEVWVMGDHRNDSVDSRCFGPVPLSAIHGVAMFVWWPPSEVRGLRPASQ